MRVFVTGASGYVGSAVVPELLAAGHEVAGLARSDASAAALAAVGAEVVRGDLSTLDALRTAAAAADGVIHLAFIHDFSNLAASAVADAGAIAALAGALEGTGKPLVVTSGVAGLAARGPVATEHDAPVANGPAAHRSAGVNAALTAAERGVRSSVVRLAPSVHDEDDRHGFVPTLIGVARERGVSGYVADGANRWPAVNRKDAAVLYRLALEGAPTGSILHGIGEEGIPTRAIAEAIAAGLDLPTQSIDPAAAFDHFGWIATFAGADAPASSAVTQELLGWEPTHPGLLDDLAPGGPYFAAS
ncbi:MAG: SDR family oxidoreductase [Solirubrobacteraceae bacterium]|nr:SDR family oxidoreductase [Solirubrobacteraceae bacterium]